MQDFRPAITKLISESQDNENSLKQTAHQIINLCQYLLQADETIRHNMEAILAGKTITDGKKLAQRRIKYDQQQQTITIYDPLTYHKLSTELPKLIDRIDNSQTLVKKKQPKQTINQAQNGYSYKKINSQTDTRNIKPSPEPKANNQPKAILNQHTDTNKPNEIFANKIRQIAKATKINHNEFARQYLNSTLGTYNYLADPKRNISRKHKLNTAKAIGIKSSKLLNDNYQLTTDDINDIIRSKPKLNKVQRQKQISEQLRQQIRQNIRKLNDNYFTIGQLLNDAKNINHFTHQELADAFQFSKSHTYVLRRDDYAKLTVQMIDHICATLNWTYLELNQHVQQDIFSVIRPTKQATPNIQSTAKNQQNTPIEHHTKISLTGLQLEPVDSIAELIEQILNKFHLNLNELADVLGISPQNLKYIKKKQIQPNQTIIDSLKKHLMLNDKEFAKLTQKPKTKNKFQITHQTSPKTIVKYLLHQPLTKHQYIAYNRLNEIQLLKDAGNIACTINPHDRKYNYINTGDLVNARIESAHRASIHNITHQNKKIDQIMELKKCSIEKHNNSYWLQDPDAKRLKAANSTVENYYLTKEDLNKFNITNPDVYVTLAWRQNEPNVIKVSDAQPKDLTFTPNQIKQLTNVKMPD